MIHIRNLFTNLSAMFVNLFDHPDWRNMVDIAIIALAIYHLIKLGVNTRAKTLFKGIAIVLAFTWISGILQLSAVNWLLQQIVNMGILVIVIVFQPELRRALDQLGRSRLTRQVFGARRQASMQTERHVAELVRAVCSMSAKHVGALIVFERNTGLGDVIESGTVVDAEISAPLIENIFEPNTPLHDGAVIIRDERIVAAACILQLSDDYSIDRNLGTRHRAALGITESTDAVSLIVSEETGIISMASAGKLTRRLDAKALTILLNEIMNPDREGNKLRRTVLERLGDADLSGDDREGEAGDEG